MFALAVLPRRYIAFTILQRFTVRIHSGLIEKGRPWLKLWYLLRGLDIQGSGFAKLPMRLVCQLLASSSVTVRQWLREGKAAGAFRFWRCQRQELRVALGGLHQLCLKLDLGLPGWGTTAEVPLHQIGELRALATGAVAQRRQQRSRFAAWRALPTKARKQYKLPQPQDFFSPGATPHNSGLKLKSQSAQLQEGEQRPSHDNATAGGIRCLLHIGRKRIFVSKGFNPFGTSQEGIAWERNYCDRTVQRHIDRIQLPHRQLVQSKRAYGHLQEAMRWDCPSIAPEPGISLSKLRGRNILSETSGTVGVNPYSQEVTPERFFKYGHRDWMYRCNIYKPEFKLCTMRRSILNYKRLLTKSRVAQVDGFINLSTQADKVRHFS